MALATTLRAMNALPSLPEGRKYLAVAPNCWGKAVTAKDAIKNARKHFPSFVGQWKFLLYDAPADTVVNDMGYAETKTEEKAVLVGYYNTTAKESPAVAKALGVEPS